MTKTEWDKMNTWQKNALVLTTLWKAENGKPIDIKWHREGDEVFYGEYIRSGKSWKTHEIDAVVVPSFTTDRNACALVLDEIEKRGKVIEFLHPLAGMVDVVYDNYIISLASWRLLRAVPDLLCYCAVKAVEVI